MSSVPGHIQGSSAAALWTQHVYDVPGRPDGSLLRRPIQVSRLQGAFWSGCYCAEELRAGQHRRGLQAEQEDQGAH